MEEILKMLLKRFDTLETRMTETRDEVVRVTTKIDDYNGLREKVDKACNMSINNETRIKKLESSRVWLNRVFWGAIVTGIVTIILTKGLW